MELGEVGEAVMLVELGDVRGVEVEKLGEMGEVVLVVVRVNDGAGRASMNGSTSNGTTK